MKTCINTYSYLRRIQAGGFTLFDAVKHARDTGFECIEFSNLFNAGNANADYAAELRGHCEKVGIKPVSYVEGADLITGSGGDQAKEVERLKGLIDVAAVIGVEKFRHDATRGFAEHIVGRSFHDAIELIVPAIRELTVYAESKGIKTMCENHGFYIQESRRMEKLVRKVAHPNFGLLVDIGNFLCADDDPVKAVSVTGPYAFHVHLKDFLFKDGKDSFYSAEWLKTRGGNFIRGTVLGHGSVPLKQCIHTLRNFCGYMGSVSLEFEGPEDTLAAIESSYKAMVDAIC